MKNYDRHRKHLLLMMLAYVTSLIAVGIWVESCADRKSVPRPAAYPRIERYYDTVYNSADNPLNMEFNKNAEISTEKTENGCGYRVRYSRYEATLLCSYQKVNSADDLKRLLALRTERVMLDAGSLKPKIYKIDDSRRSCHAVLFYTYENCLTPIHFIATDSSRYIVSGTALLDKIANQDSIAPVLEYINYDIHHLINRLSFNPIK